MDAKCWIHVATVTRWEQILVYILNRIHESNLYARLSDVYVSVCGVQVPRAKEVCQYFAQTLALPIVFLDQGEDMTRYERKTLEHLWQTAGSSITPFYALYLHTKGTTKLAQSIIDWVEYMMYFMVTKHAQAMQMLDRQFDTCGVDLQKSPKFHYSGNFWWATSTYIKSLSLTALHDEDYLAPEMWLLSNQRHTAACLWQSRRNMYKHLHSIYEYW